MDPRTLREIMNEAASVAGKAGDARPEDRAPSARWGATRPETPRERRERELLEADLESSPVRGTPLQQRLRNFRPDADSAVRALDGPKIWMRRLRAIEDAVEQHERQLGEAWRTLAQELEEPDEFAAAWHELAGNWSFAEVNQLIERHNRNFPAEAQLPMDPRSRDFIRINGRPYVREPLDADWILARFPPDRDAALSGVGSTEPPDSGGAGTYGAGAGN
ncbi:MAG: hypothetical protein ACJ75G_09400 [Gaiellaceae bacterium]